MISAASRPRPELNRRHFLGHLTATALGVPALQFFSSLNANADQVRKNHRSCIVLWMSGGPSHLDIWDLKPESEKNGGPFRPIDTSAPGVKICEHMPRMAKQMHHMNIIRSLDSKEGNHDRGTYLMHSGYAPNPTVVHPGWGSIAAYELGEQLKNFDLPHCVAINEPGMGAGFLGMSFSPFVIQNPNAPIANLKPPADVDAQRFDRRLDMLGQVENDFIAQRRSQMAVDHKAVYGKTIRMMNSKYKDIFRPQERIRRGARGLRPRLVRLGVPDGPAAGGAGGDLRRGLPGRLGHARQQLRDALETPAARARSGDVGAGGRPGPARAAR